MKRTEPASPPLSAEDKGLINLIADEFKPEPMIPARQAAFRARLSERLEQRLSTNWRVRFAVAATAAAVLCLLLVRGWQPEGNDQTALSEQQEAPLLYAFVDPDEYASDAMPPRSFLPGEYLVLANALDVPEED